MALISIGGINIFWITSWLFLFQYIIWCVCVCTHMYKRKEFLFFPLTYCLVGNKSGPDNTTPQNENIFHCIFLFSVPQRTSSKLMGLWRRFIRDCVCLELSSACEKIYILRPSLETGSSGNSSRLYTFLKHFFF